MRNWARVESEALSYIDQTAYWSLLTFNLFSKSIFKRNNDICLSVRENGTMLSIWLRHLLSTENENSKMSDGDGWNESSYSLPRVLDPMWIYLNWITLLKLLFLRVTFKAPLPVSSLPEVTWVKFWMLYYISRGAHWTTFLKIIVKWACSNWKPNDPLCSKPLIE